MIMKVFSFFVLLFLGTPLCAAEVWKAPDQEKALKKAHEEISFIEKYVDEDRILRQMRLHEEGISLKDVEHSYFLLDSPVIKKSEDHYSPVRFTHGQHAASIQDCAVCHHYRPEDSNLSEITRCSACHQDSFNPGHPERIGLKAAFHLQCMTCHEEKNKGPLACRDCHLKNVPDHKELVNLPDNPDPFQVTEECLRCHNDAGENLLTTAHWLWQGPSLYTVKHRKETQLGKGTIALNNY